jgi:hypothetical protein
MKSPENIAPVMDSFTKLLLAFRAVQGEYPPARPGHAVLFWRSPSGVLPSLVLEIIMAQGLRIRGAGALFSLCGGALSGCLMRERQRGQDGLTNWNGKCRDCFTQAARLLEAAGMPYVTPAGGEQDELRRLADRTPAAEIPDYVLHGLKAGGYAVSSLTRYQGGEPLAPDSPEYDRLLREFFYSALVNIRWAIATLETHRPERVVMQDGIYVDWGPMYDLCGQRGVQVTRWERGYILDQLIMRNTQGENRHLYSLRDSTWEALRDEGFSPDREKTLDAYFAQRSSGARSLHLLFTEKPLSREAFFERYGLDPAKPVWAVFPHVGWDAAFALQDLVFANQDEWLLASLQVMLEATDVNWLIKVHPSEHKLDTLSGARELIQQACPDLPPHIRIIPSNDGINTYGMLPHLDGGVTCMGTVGLELVAHGKPVVLSEAAHYGGKGFTVDARTKAEYLDNLRHAAHMLPLSPQERTLARTYAYAYFIQRQLPFRFVHHFDNLTYTTLAELAPGADPVMDLICDRILQGGEFLRPTVP